MWVCNTQKSVVLLSVSLVGRIFWVNSFLLMLLRLKRNCLIRWQSGLCGYYICIAILNAVCDIQTGAALDVTHVSKANIINSALHKNVDKLHELHKLCGLLVSIISI